MVPNRVASTAEVGADDQAGLQRLDHERVGQRPAVPDGREALQVASRSGPALKLNSTISAIGA